MKVFKGLMACFSYVPHKIGFGNKFQKNILENVLTIKIVSSLSVEKKKLI